MITIPKDSPNIKTFEYINFYGVWPRTIKTLFNVEVIDMNYNSLGPWEHKFYTLGKYPYNQRKGELYKPLYTL